MIGRESEVSEMERLLHTSQGEMLAIIGRRRVGKTFMIRQVYQSYIDFEIVGFQNGTNIVQLRNFGTKLKAHFGDDAPRKRPSDWVQAFESLKNCLIALQKKGKRKRVLFFDELPWLAERSKKNFIEALGYFWNSWASEQNIVIVLCGSASSWILNHVINAKGGLYNRVTKLIHLRPFNLHETRLLLKSQNITLSNYHITQLYMAFGGIPHYLKQIKSGKSAAEIIQALCFSESNVFQDELDNLYQALFNGAEMHLKVVRALQTKWAGLTRQQLINTLKIDDGGNISKVIKDLVQCNFILALNSYNGKKNHITYRLIDEFTIFYLKYIEHKKRVSPSHWQKTMESQAYKIWAGYAFENVCFRHQQLIVKAMKLEVIHTNFSSYTVKGSDETPGTQIDMLLDRDDGIINLIEIKFQNEPLLFTKAYSQTLRTKMAIFRHATKTRKSLFTSMVSAFGVIPNEYSNGFLAHDITVDDLFVKH
jgi:uncharacterized protein